MRSLLLFLSRQARLREWMETSRAGRLLSSRFVAGLTLPEAVAAAKSVNAGNMSVTLDHLGENITSLEEAEHCRDAYLEALAEIARNGIDGNVSLKLTQFGMDLSEGACRDLTGTVVRAAAGLGNFVRVDMESSRYTDRTLRLVMDLHAQSSACGAAIQAYLHRSAGDIEELNRRHIRVRLCKGAYLEPAEAAFQQKWEVDKNFLLLAKKLLVEGNYPALATHDANMIGQMIGFVKENRIASSDFEFQMLYGIRRDLQKQLIAQGYRVRIYVPYGAAWYPYFMRRLAERPANLLFMLRNFARG